MAKTSKATYPPLVFNVFKPAGVTSYDIIRYFKKNLPKGFGKIGHFGTLDPFACGVLMIGIAGASKINNYVHELMPKTYLAVGKLGVHTETGDLTVAPDLIDNSKYLSETISCFDKTFIEKQLNEKFLGDYLQAPHQYSASKYQGKALHKWVREDGIEIKKEPVLRQIYSIQVVKYKFPYLSVRVKVSSGTYVRTLFSDFSKFLGTYGTLCALVRESVGKISSDVALQKGDLPIMGQDKSNRPWDCLQYGYSIDQVLPFKKITLNSKVSSNYRNGMTVSVTDSSLAETDSGIPDRFCENRFWIQDETLRLLGLGKVESESISPIFNLPQY